MRDTDLADRLYALRKERGDSQFRLAVLVGVSDKAVSKWETGAAKPRPDKYPKLACVLGVEIGELFDKGAPASFRGGHIVNTEEYWNVAEQRLFSLYGERPDPALIDRLKTEKNFLRDTDAPVLFTALARVRRAARAHHTLPHPRGPLNGSFTAHLLGATDLDPLPAYTYCPACGAFAFHPEVRHGWDLPKQACGCGCELSRDGHSLPFEAYSPAAGSGFTCIDCDVAPSVVPQAWEEILSLVQEDYTCDRYVYRQGEETGSPGQFSRLYIHPGHTGPVYRSIDEVPEITDREKAARQGVSSICLIDLCADEPFFDLFPPTDALLDPAVLRRALAKNCCPRYRPDGIATFGELAAAEAASCASFAKGTDLVRFAEEHGLSSFTDLPLTREDVWLAVTRGSRELEGIAGDILHDARFGRYARGAASCSPALAERLGLPAWFPEYVSRIVYLFPKAHVLGLAYRHLLEALAE